MKNIALALSAGKVLQRNIITQYFAAKAYPHWHWIDDFWIVQVPDDVTAKSIHAELEALPGVGKPTFLVFEFSHPVSYWGRCNKQGWEWLKNLGAKTSQ